MLIVSRSEVEQVLTMEMALEGCKDAYQAVSRGSAIVPQRHAVHVAEKDGDMLVMSGYLPDGPALGLKVVSVFPRNRQLQLENTVGALLLLSPDTGWPLALMDGTFITAIRTGAGSGVATDVLALKGASTLAILGTGGMAWHQLEAVCAVRPIRDVYVWNRSTDRARAFATMVKARRPDLRIHIESTPETAVRSAKVICTATSSHEPVLLGDWLQPGAHLNLIGAHRAEWSEADPAAVQRADVLSVDSYESALLPGDLANPLEAGLIKREDIAEIGSILQHQQIGRTSASDITLFKSVGLAAQDLAVAIRLYERIKASHLGTEIQL